MKKSTWITTFVILILIVFCVAVWQAKSVKDNKLEVMCKSSVNSALEHFNEYQISGKESDYIASVAEFRTYMTEYLCLVDDASDTDYFWCNVLYGYMTLTPEKVKARATELVDALEYLSEDYDHPNGFNLINALNNQFQVN